MSCNQIHHGRAACVSFYARFRVTASGEFVTVCEIVLLLSIISGACVSLCVQFRVYASSAFVPVRVRFLFTDSWSFKCLRRISDISACRGLIYFDSKFGITLICARIRPCPSEFCKTWPENSRLYLKLNVLIWITPSENSNRIRVTINRVWDAESYRPSPQSCYLWLQIAHPRIAGWVLIYCELRIGAFEIFWYITFLIGVYVISTEVTPCHLLFAYPVISRPMLIDDGVFEKGRLDDFLPCRKNE